MGGALGRIPEETLQTIRERIDIAEIISNHIALRQFGRNFKGLCPFHNEKTPSFNVNLDRQIFHCFGCGVGGNVFDFIMRHDKLTFPEAVRLLAKQCGVVIPERSVASGLSEQLERANQVAHQAYRDALQSERGKFARNYLTQRGVDPKWVEHFELGLAPDSWDTAVNALSRANIKSVVGEKAGLLIERKSGGYYDRLRDRIIFPIRDVRGRILGFGGRALSDQQNAKYLNSPETPLYHKSQAFYGFPHALEFLGRTNRAVVVEGYFDVLALAAAGIGEAVATCGTALTADHARNLARRVNEVVLLFDADDAGEKAVRKALDVLLPEGLRVLVVWLEAGEDPASILQKEGAAALCKAVEGAMPALEHVIRRAIKDGCRSAWEKSDAVAAVAPVIAMLSDPVERAEWVRRLALAANSDAAAIAAVVRSARRSGNAPSDVELPNEAVVQNDRNARFYGLLGKIFITHPQSATAVSREELESVLEEGSWRQLLIRLHEEALGSGNINVAGLADQLEAVHRSLLFQISSDESLDIDHSAALRALEETLLRLRERRLSQERRESTKQLFDNPNLNTASWLEMKQRQLEEKRRAAQRGVTPTVSH